MTNESDVRWLLAKEFHPNTNVVTHAEYRALEESNAKLDADFWRVTKQNADLMAELAALRGLTAELCVARDRLIEAKDRLRKVVSRRKFGSRPQLQENADEAERDFWVVMEAMK